MLRAFVYKMACAAAAEINILDPDHVLLGGGVMNMQGFPRTLLDEKLYMLRGRRGGYQPPAEGREKSKKV